MRTEVVGDGSRLSAASRYESLVGVSNAIGTHRDPKDLFSALVRELHRVVRFDCIGVSIRDEKSIRLPAFRRLGNRRGYPPGPEAMEESDCLVGLPESRASCHSLENHDGRFSKLQEILKTTESTVSALSL